MQTTDARTGRQLRSLRQQFTTRSEGDDIFIEGYFAVFDSPYELWPGATEIIKPGAFSACLGGDIRALINHETRLVLGRTFAGTLTLREDAHGLWGRITVNRSDGDAMNLYARVLRGDVDQCSFGFDIVSETFVDNGDGTVRWEINEVVLYEVSVVTFPAYEETAVSARKKDLETITRRKNEAWRAEIKKHLKGEANGT